MRDITLSSVRCILPLPYFAGYSPEGGAGYSPEGGAGYSPEGGARPRVVKTPTICAITNSQHFNPPFDLCQSPTARVAPTWRRRQGWCKIGAAVLESKFIGPNKDQLQLKFLHVSRAYRRQGLGRQLFELAKAKAQERGARRLYISATPSENTINFYLRLGCTVTQEPDPELFELEPEDIHLEYEV